MNLRVIYQLHLYSCYSGFNDNGSHSLRYMNSWFAVGEPTWEILGEVVLEEMCQWEWLIDCKSPCHSQMALLLWSFVCIE